MNGNECIHLHIKILTPPSLHTVSSMLTGMQEVYKSAGFRVELISTERLRLPDLTNLDVGNCIRGVITPEQRKLFAHRKDMNNNGKKMKKNEICVYFVNSTNPPSTGCGAHVDSAPSAVVSRFATRWTLAHEVGHVLTLEHINNNDQLMTGNGTNNITRPPPNLVPNEVIIIRNSGFIHPC